MPRRRRRYPRRYTRGPRRRYATPRVINQSNILGRDMGGTSPRNAYHLANMMWNPNYRERLRVDRATRRQPTKSNADANFVEGYLRRNKDYLTPKQANQIRDMANNIGHREVANHIRKFMSTDAGHQLGSIHGEATQRRLDNKPIQEVKSARKSTRKDSEAGNVRAKDFIRKVTNHYYDKLDQGKLEKLKDVIKEHGEYKVAEQLHKDISDGRLENPYASGVEPHNKSIGLEPGQQSDYSIDQAIRFKKIDRVLATPTPDTYQVQQLEHAPGATLQQRNAALVDHSQQLLDNSQQELDRARLNEQMIQDM